MISVAETQMQFINNKFMRMMKYQLRMEGFLLLKKKRRVAVH